MLVKGSAQESVDISHADQNTHNLSNYDSITIPMQEQGIYYH